MSQPNDYPPLAPYLTVNNAAKAIEFYKTAFGAVERFHLAAPDGKIGHCEMTIGGQLFMLADEWHGMNKSPTMLGGVTAKFVIMVPDADATHKRALEAGATQITPPADMFYGFRSGCLRDPFGHEWMVQHEIEKLSPAQMQERWNAMMGG